MFEITAGVIIIAVAIIVLGLGMAVSRFFQKVGPEEAIIRSGAGGLQVATGSGIFVVPILHRAEYMDLSVKRIEISRRGEAGLICKDNMRADIEVAWFVRVNTRPEDILQVAQSLGCRRASEQQALEELFSAKFSEALKSIGKQFNFVDLYTERERFRQQIVDHIGTDLNGYVLEDCAIDYLEQTPVELLNPQNILDAEGIKKITDLTAREHVLSNQITRDKEKTIKKQDVEAQEAIYELERQRVEAEQRQQREIAAVTAREQSEASQVQEQERLKAERARISTEEELQVAEENKLRQVIVASRAKERTDAVEGERVERDRQLEVTERERVVGLADIDKEKAIETQKRDIQDVIRERVVVERAVVEEQERIKDTQEFATAERAKKVAVTAAEEQAQQALVRDVTAAEAARTASEHSAKKRVIEAEAEREASEKEMEAVKMRAEGRQAEVAADGLAEARVISARAEATEREGTAEATVMELKFTAEAKGIEEKANAMKLFDGVGREHEEFKLRLNKDKEIEIAAIDADRLIAEAQSNIVGEALESARIDIVGGESTFFNQIVGAVRQGKAIDRLVNNSATLSDVKNSLFNGDPNFLRDRLSYLVEQFNISTDDVRDLSIAALIGRMLVKADGTAVRAELNQLLSMARATGVAEDSAESVVYETNGEETTPASANTQSTPKKASTKKSAQKKSTS